MILKWKNLALIGGIAIGSVVAIMIGLAITTDGDLDQFQRLDAKLGLRMERVFKIQSELTAERTRLGFIFRREMNTASNQELAGLWNWYNSRTEELKEIGAENVRAAETIQETWALLLQAMQDSDGQKFTEVEKALEDLDESIKSMRKALSDYHGAI